MAKVNPTKTVNAKNLPEEEYFFGHKCCAGCGESIATRLALKVLGERSISAVPPNCVSTTGFIFPHMAFTRNALITPFSATGAVLSGIDAGLKAQGVTDYYPVGIAGDGGTADIGLQALSGAIDRGDKFIYLCLDNEAYMNTGIQKSSLTPYGTRTTTSPVFEGVPGSRNNKKNMFEIVAANDIAYAATCSVGYPQDFLKKLNKAKNIDGPAYLHVYAPCPTGWGTSPHLTVELGKEVVDCGLWYLAEYEDGEFILNKKPKEFTSVKEHLHKQRRFRHLQDKDIDYIVEQRDKKWAKILKNWITP